MEDGWTWSREGSVDAGICTVYVEYWEVNAARMRACVLAWCGSH